MSELYVGYDNSDMKFNECIWVQMMHIDIPRDMFGIFLNLLVAFLDWHSLSKLFSFMIFINLSPKSTSQLVVVLLNAQNKQGHTQGHIPSFFNEIDVPFWVQLTVF